VKAGDDLALAISAAKTAGNILMEFWAQLDQLTISNKRVGDFVSDADIASENYLRSTLLGQNPEDSWLGEESGAVAGGGRRWIVDPLDGTTNFLRGIPHWAVSIGLEVDGELVAGVVHDPVKNETFSAELGKGAYLNQAPIHSALTTSLQPALFGTGIPFGSLGNIDDHAHDIARLMPLCAGVRRMGAAALDIAYVASGRFDGFWERNLKLWDIAGGLVIASEAGVRVEDIAGGAEVSTTGSLVCAAPGVFDAFARIIRAG
jgi:myo-inositol-1(or 4)-monophosphatase